MARLSTTNDAFAAIAEPRRRELLTLLAGKSESLPGKDVPGRDVSWIVRETGWPQPQVSKHLGILREVGLVSAQRDGKRRVYKVNGEALKPVYEWVKMYERFWTHQMNRIKERAERMARETRGGG